MEFRRALLRVANEIGQQDLDKLKFACSDQIPDAKRERIHTAIDLFVAFEERGLVSSDNLEYLARQLRHIGRAALLCHFQQLGIPIPTPETSNPANPRCENSFYDTPVEERLNKFLLYVSDKLTCSEVDRLAFAWCKGYLNKSPDQIHSAFQLFTLMTQRMAISADNLDVLYIELSEMGRQDLCRAIEDYYSKNGIRLPLYPYYPPSSSSSVTTPTAAQSPFSDPYSGNYGYSDVSPSGQMSPSLASTSRPSDLSLSSPSSNSSDYKKDQGGKTSADNHQTPNIVRFQNPNGSGNQVRREPSEGNSALVVELHKKKQELEDLTRKLETEKTQRKIETKKNSSLVGQHQNQISMLQEALKQKNLEIQEIYNKFMDQNIISKLNDLSLSQPLPEAEYYPMSCQPHGCCVIFNNHQFYQVDESHEQLMDRGGADVDQKTLIETFNFLQYKVEVYENLSSCDIIARMKEVSSRDHTHYDSFICCILTHGEEGMIFGSDSLSVNLQDLTGLVKGTFCPTLINKPKLFFVQACRGEREDKGVSVERDGDSSLPVEADYFFGYATPTGKAAYRSRRHGSWFISELCNVFNSHSFAMGLSSMMKKVNRSVSEAYTKEGYKQCTEVVDRLRREVKFLPSYPANNLGQ